MNIKGLKEYIKDLPDDMEVEINNLDSRGIQSITIGNVIEIEWFRTVN